MEPGKITNLTALIKENNTANFVSTWKPFLDFVLEMEKIKF